MHETNRRKNARTGTHPGRGKTPPTRPARRGTKAFTMIELGVAVLIFTLIAGVATLAVARAQLSAAKDRFERGAEAELNALLAVVATGSYDNLVAGNFLRPEPCTEAAHLSCPDVHGRTLTVSWTVTGVADPTGTSTENLAGVVVGVSTELPFGGTLERERFVAAANAGSEGTTLVRVSLSGTTYDGPLYLITDAGTVAGSAIVDDMSALIRSDTASCTSGAPCRLALRPDGTAREDRTTLDHLAVTGDGIVLDDDTVFETGAVMRTVREIHAMLLAENADGRRAWADAAGSVCLYLSIPTPTGIVEEPSCNTESPERVIWRTYHPDRTNHPELTIALPVDVDMQILTDPSTATCNATGQTGWAAGTWTTSAVCTGWTWGTFDELRPDITGNGTPITDGARLEPSTSGDAYYTLVWTAATGAPASGHADGTLWEKPRDIPSCATTATCVAPSTNPDASCPTGYCHSSRASAPILLEPRRGTYKIPAVAVTPGEVNTITLVVGDTEDDDITVTVDTTVSGLEHDGESVSDGAVLADQEPGPVSIELTIEPSAGFTSDTLTLALGDGASNRNVDVVITASPPAAHTVIAPPLVVRQNDTRSTRILAIDDAGELASGLSFAHNAPSGITLGSPAEIGPGVYTAAVAATVASAGSGTYTLSSGNATDTGTVIVTAEPGDVDVTGGSAQQGADGTLTANVTDATGSAMSGAHVWFDVTTGGAGTVPLGTYPNARGCVTDATGSCDVVLTVEQNATVGTFTVIATSGTKTGTGTVTVTPSIAKIVSDGIEVEQGSSAMLAFTAYNGRNEPAAAISFTASVTATGATVTAAGTTGSDGTAVLTVGVGTSTPVGELVITVDDGANQHQVRVEVLSTVTTIEVPGATLAAQYGNGAVTVTARNGQGAAVPFAVLDLSPATGILSPDSVVTKANGTATIAFTVGTTTATGASSIAVSYDGTSIGSVPITVVAGVANLTTASTLQPGVTRTVRLTITDNSGGLIGGRDLTLTSADSRLSIATKTVRTNLFGYADFTVTAGNVPAGTYDFTVSVDGRVIPLALKANP